MNKYIILILAFLLCPLFSYGQNSRFLEDAELLIGAGEYSTAIANLQKVLNNLSGQEKEDAQILIETSRYCVNALENAKTAMAKKEYDKAIEEYENVIRANPDDPNVPALLKQAKALKEKARNPYLNVDKTSVSFKSTGGFDTITVTSNRSWSVTNMASTSFYSVSTNTKENTITIQCNANSSSDSRSASIFIKTTDGAKEQRITVTQKGKPAATTDNIPKTIFLTVKTEDINVDANSGSIQVNVTTNAESYEVYLLPAWCKVERMSKDSFILSYEENRSTAGRSDWFYVKAGDKKSMVRIKQSGRVSASTPQKKRASTNTSTARKTHFFVDAAYGFGTFTVTNSQSDQTLWTKEKAAEGSLSVGGFAGKENHVFLGVGFAFQSYLERSAKFGELFFDCRFVSSPERKTHLFLDLRPGVVGPIGDPEVSGITGFHLGAIGGFEFEISKNSTLNIGIRAGQTILTNGNTNRCGIIAPSVGISF